MMWQWDPYVIFLARWHISVLLDKTKKYAFGGMSHVKIFGPKTVFFLVNYLRDHYALLFYPLLHKLILLFLRFEFAQESKNFQKMDIDDVQNRDRRNTFGKIRAALGVLRNFFGAIFGRPYMQWWKWCVVYLKIHLAAPNTRSIIPEVGHHMSIFLSSVLKPIDAWVIRMLVNVATLGAFDRSWCRHRFVLFK